MPARLAGSNKLQVALILKEVELLKGRQRPLDKKSLTHGSCLHALLNGHTDPFHFWDNPSLPVPHNTAQHTAHGNLRKY